MIIVTGAAGLIGSAVVRRLNEAGEKDILCVDNLGTSEKWKNLASLRFRAYMHKSEFLQRIQEWKGTSAPTWAGPVEAVVHMGACSSTTEQDMDYLMQNNVEYTKAVCRFALDRGARFVNASSAATYGDGSLGFRDGYGDIEALRPLNRYGWSKQLFDLWAKDTGLAKFIASLKFFNVYGPGEGHKGSMQSVMRKAFFEISETGRMRLFKSDHPDYPDGGQMRDFVYVKDCADLILRLLERPRINGLFNVGTGEARTWNDLAKAVFAAMDREPAIDYVDMPEILKGKYQNFTQADMSWLEDANLPQPFRSIERGADDYVRNHLAKGDWV